jgi:hypothetical protein
MSSCTGTTSKPLAVSGSGGRNGSRVCKLLSSSSTLVRAPWPPFPPLAFSSRVTGFVYFASYTYFVSTYHPALPHWGHCTGEEFAAIAGCVILSSYLVLFISFYIATYRKAGPKGRKRRDSVRKATIDMARYEIPTAHDIAHPHGTSKANGTVSASGLRTPGPATRSRKA